MVANTIATGSQNLDGNEGHPPVMGWPGCCYVSQVIFWVHEVTGSGCTAEAGCREVQGELGGCGLRGQRVPKLTPHRGQMAAPWRL